MALGESTMRRLTQHEGEVGPMTIAVQITHTVLLVVLAYVMVEVLLLLQELTFGH